MKGARLFLILALSLWALFAINIRAQENYTYYSYPDLPIPPEGDPGLWDTISVPIDVVIEDANFYVGIETFYYLAGILVITITSPWGEEVTLHYRNPDRDLPKWFDTEEEEDGPGDLDDFIGYNGRGDWVMHVYIFAGSYPLTWDSWAVEIIGEATGIDKTDIPLQTGLGDNYPNPFNSQTVIHYSLAGAGEVTFKIYNVLGEIVRSYDIDHAAAGYYQLKWDGKNAAGESVASGVYFARMTAVEAGRSSVFSRKLILLK